MSNFSDVKLEYLKEKHKKRISSDKEVDEFILVCNFCGKNFDCKENFKSLIYAECSNCKKERTNEAYKEAALNKFKDDRFLFNWFKSLLFPKIHKSKLRNLDKKVIEAKILIHKIRRSLNVNK